jgi:hypothetical protein
MVDLLALEKGVENETSVGKPVDRERMRLLYTASIGHTSLAHVWVANVVIRPISPTILVFGADVRGRRVRKVVVDFGSMRDGGFYTQVGHCRTYGSRRVYSRTRLLCPSESHRRVARGSRPRARAIMRTNGLYQNISCDKNMISTQLTPIFRSSTELICLNASMAAA